MCTMPRRGYGGRENWNNFAFEADLLLSLFLLMKVHVIIYEGKEAITKTHQQLFPSEQLYLTQKFFYSNNLHLLVYSSNEPKERRFSIINRVALF